MKLTRQTVEDMSLEDLAMEYDHRLDLDGQQVQWGTLNHAKLQESVRRLNKVGEEAMQPFMTWLVERFGDKASLARLRALIVWRCLVENREDPAERLFHRDRYGHVQRISIRKALSRFATWMIETTDNQQDLDYAKALANRLARVPYCRALRDRQRKFRPRSKTVLFTNEQVDKLFKAIEERHALYEAKRPWMRPVIRVAILAGVLGNEDFYHIERETLVEEVRKHEAGKPAAVPFWTLKAKSRQIPISIAPEEFKVIAEWPFPWGILGDLVSPTSKNPPQNAVLRMHAELKAVFMLAGIEWNSRNSQWLNKTTMRRIWDNSQDFLLMQSMFGMDMTACKQRDYLKIPISTF